MKGISEYLDLHSSALALRSKRNKILASNIANAATPHFKARDINFEAEMQKVQREGPLRTTDVKHIPVLAKANGNEMLYRQPLNASRDGNTVEIFLIDSSQTLLQLDSTDCAREALLILGLGLADTEHDGHSLIDELKALAVDVFVGFAEELSTFTVAHQTILCASRA